ncbi:hypothetical protein B0H10DRAFT_2145775, partial [Mycena sp. CBHHK59/15]
QTGAFFPHAQNFVIIGGQFKSISNVHQASPSITSDFRIIRLGDLDIRKEIQLDSKSGAMRRRHGRASVRRVYSARIPDYNSSMTVAVYQGESADEEWRQDILQYAWLRHPNLVQLYGISSSSGIRAAIFHDELIPYHHLMVKHRESPLWIVHFWYFLVCLQQEFMDAQDYIFSVSAKCPVS